MFTLTVAALMGALAQGQTLEPPTAVHDRRAHTARHTDTIFTMPDYPTREAWEEKAAYLRRQVLLSSGLYPLPDKTPMNPVVEGRIAREGYSVEKVRFEARPGFLVTGNLYLPEGAGPYPAVVCPHGHWTRGRLEDGERGSVPARCITLARMGIAAFSYDMIGYNDSQQFPHDWGGEKEKLWGIHPFAMQLWSSIRAVDFVQSLPGVDPERIGCVGASGGGTQTFALYAVDDRIKVAAPVNMISSTMQGGCLCENAPILRLLCSNMEIGATIAPRPLLMVSATGDWTRETPRVEYPAIRSIYALYGAEDRVETVQIDAGHNFNQASREAVYRFLGKWLLGEGDWTDFTEPAYTVEPDADLRNFPDDAGLSAWPSMEEVIARVVEDAKAKWRTRTPIDQREVLAAVMGVARPAVNDIRATRLGLEEGADYVAEHYVISRPMVDDAVPALLFHAKTAAPQDAVIVVHGEGKAALLEDGGPGPLIKAVLEQGKAVLCIDAFLLGEHHLPGATAERYRVGRFMDTFEPTDTGCRVQDVLTAAAFLRSRRDLTDKVSVLGLGDGGVWALFASAVDGGMARTVADLSGFDPDDDNAWVSRFYIPCIRSVGDVRTAVALHGAGSLQVLDAVPDTGTLAAAL